MSLGADVKSAGTALSFRRRWVAAIAASLAIIVLTTMVLYLIQPHVSRQHLIFIYLVPTSLIAIRYGSIAAMCVTIVSSIIAAFFFYQPLLSFEVEDPLNLLELCLFCVLALLASQVVSGIAGDREVARRRDRGWLWRAAAGFWNGIRLR